VCCEVESAGSEQGPSVDSPGFSGESVAGDRRKVHQLYFTSCIPRQMFSECVRPKWAVQVGNMWEEINA
jgi:hypothetical protein